MEKLLYLDQIDISVYARVDVVPERVKFFEDFYTSKDCDKIPLIEITDGNPPKLIEGRTRYQALLNLENGHRCQYKFNALKGTASLSNTELLLLAMKKNLGGAMPLSREDFAKCFRVFIANKTPLKMIVNELGLPYSICHKYQRDTFRDIENQKAQQAAIEVRGGHITVKQAAEKYDVGEKSIRHYLGERGHTKSGEEVDGTEHFKQTLSQLQKSYAQKIANHFKNLTRWYQDGFKTEKEIRAVMEHNSKLVKRLVNNHNTWNSRFMHLFNEHKK